MNFEKMWNDWHTLRQDIKFNTKIFSYCIEYGCYEEALSVSREINNQISKIQSMKSEIMKIYEDKLRKEEI